MHVGVLIDTCSELKMHSNAFCVTENEPLSVMMTYNDLARIVHVRVLIRTCSYSYVFLFVRVLIRTCSCSYVFVFVRVLIRACSYLSEGLKTNPWA